MSEVEKILQEDRRFDYVGFETGPGRHPDSLFVHLKGVYLALRGKYAQQLEFMSHAIDMDSANRPNTFRHVQIHWFRRNFFQQQSPITDKEQSMSPLTFTLDGGKVE